MTRFVLDCGVLQADAFVTLDADLARRVEGVVPTATIEAPRTPGET